MRFVVASVEHARRKARLLQALLARTGVEANLTACQATVARALGYASWAEMLARAGRDPSPVDEEIDLQGVVARIESHVAAVADGHGLGPAEAAGVARALRLTARGRSDDVEADLSFAKPYPRRLVDGAGEAPAGGAVEVWLQQWEESERGWGTRPDGYSVHASPADARAYLARVHAGRSGPVPDEYDRPSSDLVRVVLDPGHPAVAALRAGRTRLWGDDARACDAVWPRSGGGWVSLAGGGSGRLA